MNPFRRKKEILTSLKNIDTSDIHYQEEIRYPNNIPSKRRIDITVDEGSFREICRSVKSRNPLKFPGYEKKIKKERDKTDIREAVITGTARIGGNKAVLCVMDNRFMMASMGMAVGEKITRAFEYATRKKLPVIVYATSGGARMQEGIFSLFQMAKTAAAVKRHSEAGLLYISVMTHPTTGGVTASFASLADIIIAEPKVLIGFAGPRVIEQTIGESLPEGFQSAEYLMEHGFVDCIVERKDMRDTLITLLDIHQRRRFK